MQCKVTHLTNQPLPIIWEGPYLLTLQKFTYSKLIYPAKFTLKVTVFVPFGYTIYQLTKKYKSN